MPRRKTYHPHKEGSSNNKTSSGDVKGKEQAKGRAKGRGAKGGKQQTKAETTKTPTTNTEVEEEEEEKEEEETEEWRNSRSKALLRTELLSGQITSEMKPLQIYNRNPEIHGAGNWTYTNWANNLRTLRKGIERDRNRMLEDVRAYAEDLDTLDSIGRGHKHHTPFFKTPAYKLLKEDIDKEQHLEKKPSQLHQTREEYKPMELTKFRKHIYQEKDSRAKREIRFEKKKKAWKYPELHEDHPRLQDNE